MLLASPVSAAYIDLGTLRSGDSPEFSGGNAGDPNIIKFKVIDTEYLQLAATIAAPNLKADTSVVLDENIDGFWKQIAFGTFTKDGFWNAAIGATGKGLLIDSGEYSFTVIPASTDHNHSIGYSMSITAIPEMSSWLMMCLGFFGLGMIRLRRNPI